MIKYYHIKYFNDFIRSLRNKKSTFILEKTSYTKVIKIRNRRIIFNENGESDIRLLSLINKTRQDAKKYMEGKTINDINTKDISFYTLYDNPSDKLITKVDIKSAYWMLALKKGIVSEKTNKSFIEMYEGFDVKIMKAARLKALGSLATRKQIIQYNNGSIYDEYMTEQPTRNLYLSICQDLDNIMIKCRNECPEIVYYYWDCIFVNSRYSHHVIEFMKLQEFDVSVGETRLEYIDIGDNSGGYLLSKSDDKIYMVKKEEKFLIDSIWNS